MENNPMENKKKLPLIIGGVVVIILLILLIVNAMNKKSVPVATDNSGTNAPAQNNGSATNLPQIPTQTDKFRADVPQDVKVPGMNEKLTEAQKAQIAVPNIVTPAAPGSETSFRSFDIQGVNGKFLPAEIIVRQNDIVHVDFTATDKSYDIVFPSYGMRQVASKGQKKVLEFQAVTEGSFTYYCDSCGGPNGPTKGKIIVVK